jgi:hypothetical protein
MIPQTTLAPPRADFERSDFERIISQKGADILFEKALMCPCKSKSTNSQSNCKNCGGSGWLFVNPKETRMLVSGLSIVNDVKPWSEEERGTIVISASDTEELAFMDRLTLINGEAIYQEVLHFKRDGGEVFAYTAYPIKKLLYGGLFLSSTTPLQNKSTREK